MPANPKMQNFARERVASSKLYANDYTTGGEQTTNRTFAAGKTGRTGMTGPQPSAWREQHAEPSIEAADDQGMVTEKR